MRLKQQLQTARGIMRSLSTYYGSRGHLDAMTEFYRALVRPGDLVFDIGSHVGDRVTAFRRLECRVVAIEPQPALSGLLRARYAMSRDVTVIAAAASDQPGRLTLNLNFSNPTVATASPDFITAAQNGAVGWHGQVWDSQIEVKAVSLDSLIAAYGVPAFVKIDVEGLEDRVLAGLSQALPALSFEFTTHQRDVAYRSLDRLKTLGAYRFNACLGESWSRVFDHTIAASEIAHWVDTLAPESNSGDIYCFRDC